MIRLLPALFIFFVISACGNKNLTDAEKTEQVYREDWEQEVISWRKQKDDAFAMGKESPFADDVLNFKGLKYFASDANYRVNVVLEKGPAVKKEIVDSKGEKREMAFCGNLVFELNHKKFRLPAFKIPEDTMNYFIMFRDLTNGKETYGGGRYIEVPVFNDQGILDFNFAYNPFCHYNHNYSCPVVPIDCKLDTEIKAGEKMYSGTE